LAVQALASKAQSVLAERLALPIFWKRDRDSGEIIAVIRLTLAPAS
jgi:hypothetical protein